MTIGTVSYSRFLMKGAPSINFSSTFSASPFRFWKSSALRAVRGPHAQLPHKSINTPRHTRQPSVHRSVYWEKQQRNGVIAYRKCLLRKSFSYTCDSSAWLVIAQRKCLLRNSFSYTSHSSAWRRFYPPRGIIKFYVKVVSFGQCKTEGSLVVEVKRQN
jgi:hypothetical protein